VVGRGKGRLSESCWKILSENFHLRMQNLGLKIFLGKLGGMKISTLVIISVGNLQLSVGKIALLTFLARNAAVRTVCLRFHISRFAF